MPRHQVPSYRHHKPSGQAVTIRAATGGRRDVYLGPDNSPESDADRAVRQLAAILNSVALSWRIYNMEPEGRPVQ